MMKQTRNTINHRNYSIFDYTIPDDPNALISDLFIVGLITFLIATLFCMWVINL